SALCRHVASTAVPARTALLKHTALPTAFRPAARIFRAAQAGVPVIAPANPVAHAVAVASTPVASPGHGLVPSALVIRLASFFSTLRRHAGSTSPPARRAWASHSARPCTAAPKAFSFAAAHFCAAVGAARTRGGAPTSQRSPTAPTNHTGRARDVISGMDMLPRRWTDLDRAPAILADTGVTLTRPEHVGQGNPAGLEGATSV